MYLEYKSSKNMRAKKINLYFCRFGYSIETQGFSIIGMGRLGESQHVCTNTKGFLV